MNSDKEKLYSFVIPSSGRSGGIRATVTLANLLVGRGYRVRILVYKSRNNLHLFIRKFILHIFYSKTHDWLDEFNGSIQSFRNMNECKFEEKEIVIGVGMWVSNEIARINAKNITKIQYLHGHTNWNVQLMRNALQHKIPKIVVASYLIPLIREISGQETVAIVPNGVDIKEYYPEEFNNRRDGIGLIYGKELPKDPETLNEIIHGLRIKFPGVPLYIFGNGRRPKVLKRYEYTRLPSISKSRENYSRSMVWIIGSKSEGFSMPILEAMACGCVVVSTNCGGPRDLIVDGKNGFLVEIGDSYDIIEKTERLIRDRKMRDTMQAESFETARRFSWESTGDKFLAAVDMIVRRST